MLEMVKASGLYQALVVLITFTDHCVITSHHNAQYNSKISANLKDIMIMHRTIIQSKYLLIYYIWGNYNSIISIPIAFCDSLG